MDETLETKLAELSGAITDKLAEFKTVNDGLAGKIDGIGAKVAGFEAKLASFSDKGVYTAPAPEVKAADAGSRLAASESYKRFKEGMREKYNNVRIELEAKPLTTVPASTKYPEHSHFGAAFDAGAVTDPRAVLTVEQLFGHVAVDSSTYQYVRLRSEIGDGKGPAAVAEGALKPETPYQGDTLIGEIKTVAHWTKISEQLLADDANIVGLINQDMQYLLNKAVDRQILSGDKAKGEIDGLNKTGNFTSYNELAGIKSGDNVIDVARKLIFTMRGAGVDNLTLLLNPADWGAVLGAKNANNSYLIPGILDLNEQRLYGVPVVLSSSVSQGYYYLGDFFQAGKVFERGGITVEIDREGDDFIRNLYTLRVERRLGFSVIQPKAVSHGEFADKA